MKKKVFAGIGLVALLSVMLIMITGCVPKIDPAISIAVSISGGPAPLKVDFTGSVIVPSNANANGWTWNFDDNTGLATGFSATHTYAQAGKYTVTLSAVVNGQSCTQTQTIEVYEPEPVECPIKIDSVPYWTSGECCMYYTFEPWFLSGTPVTYEYNFGDGTPTITSTLAQYTHRYVRKGNFRVTLRVMSSTGLWSDLHEFRVDVNGCCQDPCYTCQPDPCYDCGDYDDCMRLTYFDTPFRPYEARIIQADIRIDCDGCGNPCTTCTGPNAFEMALDSNIGPMGGCHPCGCYVTWHVYRCDQVANPSEYDIDILCQSQCRQDEIEIEFYTTGNWKIIAILRDQNGREICQVTERYGVANY